MSTLQERAVLMKFSAGLPGQHRKDKRFTAQVKAQQGLGDNSGKWIKELWPADSMAEIKAKENEARDYHNFLCLPFGAKEDKTQVDSSEEQSKDKPAKAIAGIGILPSTLLLDYGDAMRRFQGELRVLVDAFVDNPKRYIDWAVAEHNGTFNPKDYPGVVQVNGQWSVDVVAFQREMRKKFYITTELLPVPDSGQFTSALHSLIGLAGLDPESVNIRVRDSQVEAQKELMRRLIAPVQAMAEKLSELPKEGKEDIVFRDTLVGNIQAIVDIAPKLNLSEDPQIDAFIKEVETLTRYAPQVLRDDKATRDEAARKAAETLKRLSGYKL